MQRRAKELKKLAKAERANKLNDAGVNDKAAPIVGDANDNDDNSRSGSASSGGDESEPVPKGGPKSSLPIRAPPAGAKEAWNEDNQSDNSDDEKKSSRPTTATAAVASPPQPKPKVSDASIAAMQNLGRKGNQLPPLPS
jgi:hypothetical protein